MTQAQPLTPRRPIKDDPSNPLEDWLSGKLTITHPDGRLRRFKTLWKYAWCVALLGHDEDFVVAAVADRDRQDGYHKFSERRDGGESYYRVIARQVIRVHDEYARRKARQEVQS